MERRGSMSDDEGAALSELPGRFTVWWICHEENTLDLLKIGTVARRSGVTVRTLHYYEEIGLLEPQARSSSGHRLYGRDAIERLQQIRALQQLGLSLSDVSSLLRGTALSPREVITNQLATLREQRTAMDRLEAQLLRLELLLEDEGADDVEAVEVILSTLEAMNMYDKYLTPEQLKTLEEHHRTVEESDQDAWNAALADLRAQMEAGTPTDAPVVKALIERWHEAASAFMPDDEAIHEGVMNAMHEEPEALAAHGLTPELFAYIGEATARSQKNQDSNSGESPMQNAGYTFVSVSTAKQGRLDDLITIAAAPSEKMDGKVPGLIARQVGVDRDRNSVVVWATFDTKESLYDYLESEEGKRDHEDYDMSCIATFTMYDLTPVSGRLPGSD